MLILTGPTAAGKNTVGHRIARERERCAVVDFDAVRAMFVQPHRAPWQGEEGKAQQILGVRLVCALASGFADAGWEVLVLDVVSDQTAPLYRALLAGRQPQIVQMLPRFAEIKRRFDARGPVLTDEELTLVYDEQRRFKDYDLRIDNTAQTPEETAGRIIAFWQRGETR